VQAGVVDAEMQVLVMSTNSMLQAKYSSFTIHLRGGIGIGMRAFTQGLA
jgi:hypothetical protein